MKPLLSLCSLLLIVFCGFAETAEHRPVAEAYFDPELKLTFPANIREFRKLEVIRSLNPMIGTTVRYSDPAGNCADVYFYMHPESDKEISETQLNTHYQDVKEAIFSLPSKGISVKKVELIRESKIKLGSHTDPKKCIIGYQALFWIITKENIAQNSTLILFPFRGRIIKLRMTCDETKSTEFFHGIIQTFFGNL